jgi:hypothetical protein
MVRMRATGRDRVADNRIACIRDGRNDDASTGMTIAREKSRLPLACIPVNHVYTRSPDSPDMEIQHGDQEEGCEEEGDEEEGCQEGSEEEVVLLAARTAVGRSQDSQPPVLI